MNKVTLKQLRLVNFKGIKELTINEPRNISGANGTGKTTIADAFFWVLFGKDSSDAKDFNIKTLDSQNNPIHKLEHEVCAVLESDIDGIEYTHELRCIYREKWVKKKGEPEPSMDGHERLFFYNGIPLSLTEYNAKVDAIISQSVARLITNPLYFNTQLDWQKRRSILIQMAGHIDTASVIDGISTQENAEAVSALKGIVGQGKSMAEFKKELAARKKKLKDALEQIPSRVDEVERAKPEAVDFDALQKEIDEKKGQMSGIDVLLQDKLAAHSAAVEAITTARNEVQKLKDQAAILEREDADKASSRGADERKKLDSLETDLAEVNKKVQRTKKQMEDDEAELASLEKKQEQLRVDWAAESSRQFSLPEGATCCPTCKRELDEDSVAMTTDQLRTNFNADKNARLTHINEKGMRMGETIAGIRTGIARASETVEELEQQAQDLQRQIETAKAERLAAEASPVEPNPQIALLRARISEMESAIPVAPVIDNAELNERKRALASRIDELQVTMLRKSAIERANARHGELLREERELANQVAEIERTEFAIESYSRAMIETVERRVNHKFSFVRWKMFDKQINGGESECCECLVNGVPFSDLNTASRINAGIDIINALIEHFGVSAPVFIDNRESVTEIIPSQSQIINLIVKENAPLTIE